MCDEHPDVSLSDWDSLCAHSSPFLFNSIINRGTGDIRWETAPRARGMALASDYFLRVANYKAPKFRGHGYKAGYLENVGPYTLEIYSIHERQLWMIERFNRRLSSRTYERLVLSFGWTPFVTEHFKAALCCGRYATLNNVAGLKWVPVH